MNNTKHWRDQLSLRSPANIYKFLISSTSHIVGEYDRENVLITHAFPNFLSNYHVHYPDSPTSRSAFVISVRTRPSEDRKGSENHNAEYIGDLICTYLAVIFGKRFDNHGAFETEGRFILPNLAQLSIPHIPSIPQNSTKARSNYSTPLRFEEVKIIDPLLYGFNSNQKLVQQFSTACKFYLRALQVAETDFEASYLNLITCGEILSNIAEVNPADLLDQDTLRVFDKIRQEMRDGDSITRSLQGKLRQIKRRFVKTICDLIDNNFFDKPEAIHEIFALRREGFEKSIAAAYDLRSRYVHTGLSFGTWIMPMQNGANWEIQVGEPVVDDREFQKLLSVAPRFVGLERIMRYCLIKFAFNNGLFKHQMPKI